MTPNDQARLEAQLQRLHLLSIQSHYQQLAIKAAEQQHSHLDYLALLKNPPVKIRFDIVEVLLADGEVREIRHLPNTFALSKPYRYG